MAKQPQDAPAAGAYHFLDVGDRKYGDCTLVEFGNVRILIDGGHTADFAGQQGHASIPEQLERILSEEPPHHITLLVVTHCHDDHIGCLDRLVAEDIIRPQFALLTHPKLGFGREMNDDSGIRDADSAANRLAAVLREEDVSDLSDADLEAFIADVAKVETRYAGLVTALNAAGTAVTFYTGKPLPAKIRNAVAPSGMTLLGPSEEQLLVCANEISKSNTDAMDAVGEAARSGDAVDVAALYRAMASRADASAADAGNRGGGMNCQSITLAFGPTNARALLAGDMQFTGPGFAGIDDEMEALIGKVEAAGPYKLFKTTHHTAHNGQDDDFIQRIGNPRLIVHSGGANDRSHPNTGVLDELSNLNGVRFARTDRNGLITVRPSRPPGSAIKISGGDINDFTPNGGDEFLPPAPIFGGPLEVIEVESPPVEEKPNGNPQIIIVNLPGGPIDMSVGGVDIVVRSRGAAAAPALQAPVDPAMRQLAGLLFVTDRERLAANIGTQTVEAALDLIRRAGGVLVEGVGDTADDTARQKLSTTPTAKGVVILGGYDVIPALRTDVLGDALRRLLGGEVAEDHDGFWVWSDQAYGDRDGDAIAEVPVSRIPDARDSQMFLSALRSPALAAQACFGVRNVARPFADGIWQSVRGSHERPINVSHPFEARHVVSTHLQSDSHYFMLHGMDDDGRVFTGENLRGGYPTAFTIANVPAQFKGVVFTGCCWGALIVDGKAADANGGMPQPRRISDSIALSYLRAGAGAFIGCTGSHYSGPSTNLDVNYAARLHRAFWQRLGAGDPPALALHQARLEFMRWIASARGRMDPVDTARRLKNAAQFTCLGLGW